MNDKKQGFKKGPVKGIARTTEVTTNYATATIGVDGGEIHLSNAGLRIEIPKGAVKQSTTFSVFASKKFLGFNLLMSPPARLEKPAIISQDVDDATKADGDLFIGHTGIVEDDTLVESWHRMHLHGNVAVAKVSEFSGYLISSGLTMVPCDPATDGPNCVWVGDE
jgi:hypothetical protein